MTFAALHADQSLKLKNQYSPSQLPQQKLVPASPQETALPGEVVQAGERPVLLLGSAAHCSLLWVWFIISLQPGLSIGFVQQPVEDLRLCCPGRVNLFT